MCHRKDPPFFKLYTEILLFKKNDDILCIMYSIQKIIRIMFHLNKIVFILLKILHKTAQTTCHLTLINAN